MVILATKEFNLMELGETLVAEPESLIGKKVVVNLFHLTNDMKKQNVKIHFKVHQIQDDKAYTEIVGMNMVEAFLKRVVKRARNRLDDSFEITTKDNIKIRIKPLIITKNETKGSILAALHAKSREFFTSAIKESTYEQVVGYMLTNELQKKLRDNLKKIYPVAVSEIRALYKLS